MSQCIKDNTVSKACKAFVISISPNMKLTTLLAAHFKTYTTVMNACNRASSFLMQSYNFTVCSCPKFSVTT
jgi:hypothetical protein